MPSYEDIKKAADANGHWLFRDERGVEVRDASGEKVAFFELTGPRLLLLGAQDETECLRHCGAVITGEES